MAVRSWRDDPVRQRPEIERDNGRGWQVADIMTATSQQYRRLTAAWMIEAPWAHVDQHSYLLTLTAVSGLARYDLVLLALDPAEPREDLTQGGIVHALIPVVFTTRFDGIGHGEAEGRVRLAADAICAGLIDPSAVGPLAWATLFGHNKVFMR